MQVEKSQRRKLTGPWSEQEIRILKKAAIKISTSLYSDKQERWKVISKEVGTRSKKDCYEKYKEIKAERAARKEAAGIIKTSVEKESVSSSRKTAFMEDDFDDGIGFGVEAEPQSKKSSSDDVVYDIKDPYARPASYGTSRAGTRAASQPSANDLMVEDCEDFDDDFDLPPRASGMKGGSGVDAGAPLDERDIDAETACGLRRLVFGDRDAAFNDAWANQGFPFNQSEGLGFGLVQHQGGPCGAIAAVQALVLRHLLFPPPGSVLAEGELPDWNQPSLGNQRVALCGAITEILWQAGGGTACTVALAIGGPKIERSQSYRPDGITERLRLFRFNQEDAARAFIMKNLSEFSSSQGSGVVCLVYSAMLSRTLARMEADMDGGLTGESPQLMGQHGYAGQEMVNLLLVGCAHSNVFDGEQVMDDAGASGDSITLRGIPQRSLIGFFTLFEAYEYVKVGMNFKVPNVPVWVICSESHYSVLFSPDKGLVKKTSSREFDLFYYDELARQEEVIRLTINPRGGYQGNDESDSELIPPIDKVVRTRWKGATIDWNGSEPIL
mmetsp:Transcript_14732/g.21678  ORF Transcript_14732/g.21678 Transcript_14732/m.21678 type:complete len:555 (-) Transcript_14732:156-1820(-)